MHVCNRMSAMHFKCKGEGLFLFRRIIKTDDQKGHYRDGSRHACAQFLGLADYLEIVYHRYPLQHNTAQIRECLSECIPYIINIMFTCRYLYLIFVPVFTAL